MRRAAMILAGLLLMTVFAAAGVFLAAPPPPAIADGQACPAGMTCTPVLLITNGAKGMGAPFLIEDNEGKPPGQNAPMFWVDGFQVGSVNPVCAVISSTDPKVNLQRVACLGGPPFDATGGHPVLALWDGRRWQVLTARDIAWLHRAEQLRPGW